MSVHYTTILGKEHDTKKWARNDVLIKNECPQFNTPMTRNRRGSYKLAKGLLAKTVYLCYFS
jgi:hypothetical protein